MNDIESGRTLALNGSMLKPMIWMITLISVPFVIAIVIATSAVVHATAHTKPALAATTLIAPIIGVVLIAVLMVLLLRASVRVDGRTLFVNTGIGRKQIALANLREHGLRVVDLRQDSAHRPMIRLWGAGLPGFSGGWFLLRNREKALCLIFDRTRVSYLRSDADKLSLLLSLDDPDALRKLIESA